jgi:acyl-CoA reductase-like NAD-dependent aldehyde dehydrogenase
VLSTAPSPAVRNHRIAVRLALETVSALHRIPQAFPEWSRIPPLERAKLLRQVANILRKHGPELAMIDSAGGGNPIKEMLGDASVFGPIVSVLKWNDEPTMIGDVNAVDYGLTCSIWTNDLKTAHRTVAACGSDMYGSTMCPRTALARHLVDTSSPA